MIKVTPIVDSFQSKAKKKSSYNWLLLLWYDGTGYSGWQVQPNQQTIEAELENAIFQLTGETIKVFGAGRTDAGVHALNQTANFISETSFTPQKWRIALNGLLPKDIIVKAVVEMPTGFHARHSSISKKYRYLLFNQPYASPFAKKASWWIRPALDVQAMQHATSFFIGEHNFSAFRSSKCDSPSVVKNLKNLTIREEKTYFSTISIEVEANSFLQYMVRIIVGTLVDVGLGKKSPTVIPQILDSQDRKNAGPTAPPYGLYVLEVCYPSNEVVWPQNVQYE